LEGLAIEAAPAMKGYAGIKPQRAQIYCETSVSGCILITFPETRAASMFNQPATAISLVILSCYFM